MTKATAPNRLPLQRCGSIVKSKGKELVGDFPLNHYSFVSFDGFVITQLHHL